MPTLARRTPVRMMADGEGGSKHGGLTYDKSKALAGDANSSNYRCVMHPLCCCYCDEMALLGRAGRWIRSSWLAQCGLFLIQPRPPTLPNNNSKLSDAMVAAEKERKRNEEERRQREMAEELARQARAKKVAKLNEVLSTPKELVGTPDDYAWGTGVQTALDRLDKELIGLKPVKARVRELASMLVVDKMRQSIGLDPFISDGLHMCFTGAPGTGKTTVAFRMGDIFKAMGYSREGEYPAFARVLALRLRWLHSSMHACGTPILSKPITNAGHVVLATRDTLVGQYVGHTGPKTKEVIKQALGGILFIDEAYYLYNAGNDRDYGVESIEILLKVGLSVGSGPDCVCGCAIDLD